VASLCVTETVSWGILYYGFPVFLPPMEAELGWSRVQITGAFSLGLLSSALAALPVGRWIDRHGARSLMTAGSCAATLLVIAWSRVDSLPAFYALWFLMGLSLAATLYEPAFAAVVGWFPTQNRDRALLTVTLVAALASTIFMPLEAWLLVRLGWRTALATLALILALITIPIHALVLRPSPHRRPRAGAVVPDVPGISLGEAARTGVFWVLTAAFLVGNFTTNSVTVHLIPYLAPRGYSPALAAAMIGWMGAMQLPARIVFAPLVRYFGHATMTALIFFAQAVALIQLAYASRIPTLAPVVVILGGANGMSTLARATTIAELFGPRHYGAISGAVALGANGARAVGPVGASLLLLALGGYPSVFWTLAASLVLASLAVLIAGAGVKAGD